MSQKIKPSGSRKRIFVIHVLVFVAANLLMWLTYDKGADSWVYPWPAWITAAWSLSLLGHACALFASYEDRGMDTYQQQLRQ